MRTLILILCAAITVPAGAQTPTRDAWCGTDLSSDAFRADLDAYVAARRSGRLPAARKAASPPQIGDQEPFNVLEGSWTQRTFQLVDVSSDYYLWIEVERLQEMNDSDLATVQSLNQVMSSETPSGSFRPDHGIVDNNLTVFGQAPDYDGDGMLDILLYDIEPGASGGPTTLGYVSSADISPSAEEGVGNQRDVLYLDAVQGISSLNLLAGVAAHELTHLIHFRYGGNDSFIMEGLAEYGMIANGYFWRPANYLTSTAELSVPLFTWRQDLNDYERGSLFFGYIGDRVGPEVTGSIARTTAKGPDAIDEGLAGTGLTLKDIITDFHTANLVNDRTLAPEFGYVKPYRVGIHAVRPAAIDGESTTSLEASNVAIEGGAVRYIVWHDVRDLDFSFDTPSSSPVAQQQLRLRIRARLILTRDDGSREWHDLAPSEEVHRYVGGYQEALLVLTNVSGATSFSTSVDYSASWATLSTDTENDPALPASVALEPAYPNPFNPSTVLPFDLPAAGPVAIRIYDVLGRLVATVENGFREAGRHTVRIDASSWPAGTYLVVLDALGERRTRTITLLP